MTKKAQPVPGSDKQVKISQSDFPAMSLESAVRVAEALSDQFAGKSAAPHDVALAMNVSPTSSAWRQVTGAALAYGLTQGSWSAAVISLTDLGRRIVAPTEEGGDLVAKVEAMMKPRILREFFQKYDRAKFPRDDIARNVLASMGLPKDRHDRGLQVVLENGKYVGVIRDTKTGPFVALGSPAPTALASQAQAFDDGEIELDAGSAGLDELSAPRSGSGLPPASVPRNKQIFVAHGKNHKALNELKKILDQFKIPYKVAVEEPNVGRPISKKVAQLMRECSAGIFIFTGDEKFTNSSDVDVWRPSENVVYELGAASVLWENKIIILKQNGVNFPSDFNDLGYITFDEDQIAARALDLLKELIGLEFISVQPV